MQNPKFLVKNGAFRAQELINLVKVVSFSQKNFQPCARSFLLCARLILSRSLSISIARKLSSLAQIERFM
ncbi:MAG: hypothetical protein SFV22_16915, partial [Saprospiraceae bacterium]|nr:hypothetical protein [Saprospiraceae bacterium]